MQCGNPLTFKLLSQNITYKSDIHHIFGRTRISSIGTQNRVEGLLRVRVINHNNIFIARRNRRRILLISRIRHCWLDQLHVRLTAIIRLRMIRAAAICTNSWTIILRGLN
ncbi:hypothetical protein D3C77_633270 [compost metagenome]